jgi:hypothetical protein
MTGHTYSTLNKRFMSKNFPDFVLGAYHHTPEWKRDKPVESVNAQMVSKCCGKGPRLADLADTQLSDFVTRYNMHKDRTFGKEQDDGAFNLVNQVQIYLYTAL